MAAITKPQTVTAISKPQSVAGSKPVAFSLIQAGGVKKTEAQGQSQTRTVLIKSEGDATPQKLVTVTQQAAAPPVAKVRETIAKLTQQMAAQQQQNAQTAGKLKQVVPPSATTQGTTTIKIQGISLLLITLKKVYIKTTGLPALLELVIGYNYLSYFDSKA